MAVDRRKAGLFGAAIAVRLFLFTAFPSLPDLLTGRVEVSTPVTSFKRREFCVYTCKDLYLMLTIVLGSSVQEGLFMYTHNVSPYDGGIFHQVSRASSFESLSY